MNQIAKKGAIWLSLLLAATSFFCNACGGSTSEPETPYAYTVSQLGEDVMPIMSYIAPTDSFSYDGTEYPSLITDEVYAAMAALGINLMHGIGHGGYPIEENLVLCDRYGMGAILSGGNFGDYVRVYLENQEITPFAQMSEKQQTTLAENFFGNFEAYTSHSSFAGVHFADELGIAGAQAIGDATKLFTERYPDRLCISNCVGSGTSLQNMLYNGFSSDYEELLGLTTSEAATEIVNALWRWEKYADYYMQIAEPQIFSYDDYPWRVTGGNITPHFFRELETAAKYCSQNKIPFWNFIQTGKWHVPGGDYCRQPTYNEFAYQVNASLVFGAQGVECFLVTPLGSSDGGTYSSDTLTGTAKFPFDLYGNPTDLYEPLKKVFDHVKLIDDVLMKSVWKGVLESQSLEAQMTALQTISRGYALTEFNQVRSVDSETTYVLAGCFSYGGNTALYVFNANTDKSAEANADITVSFYGKVKGYSVFDGKEESFTGSSYVIKNVAPGEAALIVLG